MKILLTCSFPFPMSGNGDGGGVSNYIILLKRKLEQLGHTVDFFGYDADTWQFWIPRLNSFLDPAALHPQIEGRLLPYFSRAFPDMPEYMRVREPMRYAFELAAVYCDLASYDVINAQDVASGRAMWRVKPQHVPLITTVHGIIPYELSLRGWASPETEPALWEYFCAQERIGLVSNDWLVVTSHWTKNILTAEFGARPESLSIIQNGMDMERFLQRTSEPPLTVKPPNRKLIGCIARLAREKGIHLLIEALIRLKQDRSDWECWIIGEGTEREVLEEGVRLAMLEDHILFLGHREDAPSLIAQCDIVAVPSLQENCPYVILEAQAAGVAVVAARAGGMPEMMVHEETGILFERDNSFELFLSLKRMLEDEALRSRVALQGMNWGRSYWSIDERVKALVALYLSATGRESATISAVKTKRKPGRKGSGARKRSRRTAGGKPRKRAGKTKASRRIRGKSSTNARRKGRLRLRRRRRRTESRLPGAAHDAIYRELFRPKGSQPLMDAELWGYIRDRLPPGYTIPDPAIEASFS